jgi:hypothetical protein
MPVLLRQTTVNRPLLHQNLYFSKEVQADQEAGLRRNFVERIWLSDGPLARQMMISDPLEQSAQRRAWQGTLYTVAPGTTNLQEFCLSEGPSRFLISPRASQPLRWKPFPPALYDYFELAADGGLLGLLGAAPASRRAVGVGAVLRWGRPQRGAGQLFLLDRGVLLPPIQLGGTFPGCWAFVATPRTPDEEMRQALLDWTQAQFRDMGQSLKQLLDQGKAQELGIRFNFVAEVNAAIDRFGLAQEEWGSPLDDF